MHSLKAVRIQDGSHQHIAALGQLYLTSFPVQERRPINQFLQLLPEPDMYVHALVLDDQVAGLSIHWPFDNFHFLEHLAIAPALRSQQLGQQAVQWLLEQVKGPLVLEVEHPKDEASCRRITFYERLGLVLHAEFPYQQPPYQKAYSPVPMHLMTSDILSTCSDLHNMATIIRQQVYERFYV